MEVQRRWNRGSMEVPALRGQFPFIPFRLGRMTSAMTSSQKLVETS